MDPNLQGILAEGIAMTKKNKRIIKYILWSILFAIIVSILWIIRPCTSYDKSIIDKKLTSLEEPFKSVDVGYYMDGGSVSIEIVDKNNILLKIALPVIGIEDPSYEKVYFGVYHIDHLKEGGDEVDNPVETILMLQDILHRHSKGNPQLIVGLYALRGRVIDYIKLAYHSKMGHYSIAPSGVRSNRPERNGQLLTCDGFAQAEDRNLINYVSLYNKESQPQNFTENNNAATHYQKAIDVYVERPEGISRNDMRIWPNELTEEKREMLKEWVKQNELALRHLITGTKKPYLWKEVKSSNGSVLAILIPDLHIMRDLMYLLCCRAKAKAIEGYMKGATEDLVANFRFSSHLTGPKTMIEQMLGVGFQCQVIKAALMIIDKTRPSIEERDFLHNSLRKVTNNLDFEPNLLIMKFIGLDCLQRAYIINEDGHRALDEQELRKQLAMLNLLGQSLAMHGGAFIGKHCKTEITEISYSNAEKLLVEGIEKLEQMIFLKAWQLNKMINDEQSVLQKIQKSHPLLNSLALQAINIKLSVYEQLKLQIRGMKTIMAVLKFQENTGKLPTNLNQIRSARLLQELPIDPFSGEDMNYKKQGDGFTIYSDGLDFGDVGKRRPRRPIPNLQDRNLIIWPTGKKKDYRK